jgi:membrane protease YdiL (CAAX protease family)
MIDNALKDVGKLLLYLAASLLLGALLAPVLFHGGQWLADHGIFPSLKTQPFRRYFNRSVQVSGILLLWPLVRSLRVKAVSELGLRPNAHWWRHSLAGLAAAVLMMLALCAVVDAFGGIWFFPAEYRRGAELPKVIATAVFVGILEECIFRGAFLGLLQRNLGRWPALAVTSAFFSVLHFIKPITVTIDPAEVGWLSGILLVPAVFGQWTDPAMIGSLFTTLFAVGWVLGWATQRTHSLWMSIGLHAGWVFCAQGFGKFARFTEGGLPWIGSELQIGIAPLATVLFTGLLCRLWLNHVDPTDRG